MATTYRIGRVSAPASRVNPETGRRDLNPRPEIQLFVGDSLRLVTIELTDAELVRLAEESVSALARIRRSTP